ncbi:MAG TPA: hypothetical protein VFC17_13590 [Candidatus Limnocylindrales bacterium]|nr:hypothetical protein [Candidatus Limnocylindrales bacterium]
MKKETIKIQACILALLAAVAAFGQGNPTTTISVRADQPGAKINPAM